MTIEKLRTAIRTELQTGEAKDELLSKARYWRITGWLSILVSVLIIIVPLGFFSFTILSGIAIHFSMVLLAGGAILVGSGVFPYAGAFLLLGLLALFNSHTYRKKALEIDISDDKT